MEVGAAAESCIYRKELTELLMKWEYTSHTLQAQTPPQRAWPGIPPITPPALHWVFYHGLLNSTFACWNGKWRTQGKWQFLRHFVSCFQGEILIKVKDITEESTCSFNFTQREHARTKSRLATDWIAWAELKAMNSQAIPQTFVVNLKETRRPASSKRDRICRSTGNIRVKADRLEPEGLRTHKKTPCEQSLLAMQIFCSCCKEEKKKNNQQPFLFNLSAYQLLKQMQWMR